jgi:hypothetical protein
VWLSLALKIASVGLLVPLVRRLGVDVPRLRDLRRPSSG